MRAGVWGDKGGVGGDEEGRALAVAFYGHGVAEDRWGGSLPRDIWYGQKQSEMVRGDVTPSC